MLKTTIVSVACCALIAPLAFGKDSKTRNWRIGLVDRGVAVTVTAPNTITKMVGGEVAGYQPAGTLIVRQNGAGYYILDEPGRVFNRKGELVRGAIRPGSQVEVYFAENNGTKTIDRVVVY